MEERRRAREQEQRQNPAEKQTAIHAQSPEARKAAVVNLWRALRVEGAKTRAGDGQNSSQALSETHAKLQQAEQTIHDMKEQVCRLQAALQTAQESVTKHKAPRALQIDKETNTVREEAEQVGRKLVTDQRDAAVSTEPEEEGQTQLQVTADGLLMTLRRMEAMVNGALETAELVRQSEQRVSQVKTRMESITEKVEAALDRAADTRDQLSALEAKLVEKGLTQVCLCCQCLFCITLE